MIKPTNNIEYYPKQIAHNLLRMGEQLLRHTPGFDFLAKRLHHPPSASCHLTAEIPPQMVH
jgi:hypothetical protein